MYFGDKNDSCEQPSLPSKVQLNQINLLNHLQRKLLWLYVVCVKRSN